MVVGAFSKTFLARMFVIINFIVILSHLLNAAHMISILVSSYFFWIYELKCFLVNKGLSWKNGEEKRDEKQYLIFYTLLKSNHL